MEEPAANALNPYAVLHAWCKELRENKDSQCCGWGDVQHGNYCALSLLYYKVLGKTDEELLKYGNYEFVKAAIPISKITAKEIWAHNDGSMDYPRKNFVEIAEMIENLHPEVEELYKPYAK
jgi:hypothetical protein